MKMRSTAMLLFLGIMLFGFTAMAQQRVTIRVKDAPLSKVFNELRAQTKFSFIWNQQMLENTKKVSMVLQNGTLKEALDLCLQGTALSYDIRENEKVVYIRAKSQASTDSQSASDQQAGQDLSGTITDDKGAPLPGATVAIKGTSRGVATNAEGRFQLQQVPVPSEIMISMVGYQTTTVNYKGQPTLKISMQVQAMQMAEVAVTTGIYSRKRESFTGSAQRPKRPS